LQHWSAALAAGTELARRAAVTPAAISQLVAGLEAAGLVERASEGQDGRTHTCG